MNTVTLSSKFQVTVPRAIREELKLRPGSKMRAIHYRGRVVVIPVRSMKSMRGFLLRQDTTFAREDDRL